MNQLLPMRAIRYETQPFDVNGAGNTTRETVLMCTTSLTNENEVNNAH